MPGRPNGVLFVDMESGADVKDLRELPAEYLAGAQHVVIRAATLDPIAAQILRGRGSDAELYCLRNAPGEPTHCDSVRGTAVEDIAQLVSRCREIEVLSLLDWGEALWQPDRFHFVLPSGAHSSRFVRLSNSLREPRDAEVVADWLLPFLGETTGVLIDTGTLTPVVLALRLRLAEASREALYIAALDQYPHTLVDMAGAIDSALGPENRHLLCVISVTSSGSLRDLLATSAQRLGNRIEKMDIVSIVDLLGSNVAGTGNLKIDQFASLPTNPKATTSWQSHSCEACLDPQRSTLVPVDVKNFEAVFPTLVRREMPAVAAPHRNRAFWESCNNSGIILFEAEPDAHVRPFRPASERMAIKIDISALLSSSPRELGRQTAERLRAALDPAETRRGDQHSPAQFDWNSMDLVLVPSTDFERNGFAEFWTHARSGFSTDIEPTPVAMGEDWDTSTIQKVSSASKILVATVGTVTGTTLQQLLVRVQTIRRDARYQLFGVAFHARPSRLRSWETLRNSFGYRLVAPWFTLLPEWSPLQDELTSLGGVNSESLVGDAVTFLTDRMLICRGATPDETRSRFCGLLWGTDADITLSSHSIFGHRLGARATFVAVGSAIHTRREEARQAPERIVFEIPALARSYYDPLIFCSMLRWMRGAEMWWGDQPAQARQVVHDVLDRSEAKQREIVAAELLLAAAQRKLPRSADEEAWSLCREYLKDHPAWDVGRQLLLKRDTL